MMPAFLALMGLMLAQAIGTSGSPPAPSNSPNTVAPVDVRGEPEGHTAVRCLVTTTGSLKNCKLLEEEPAGRGFGAAALRITQYMRAKPPTRDGQPTEGVITIPVRWKLGPPLP